MKQDRQGVRTPSDVEQKYGLGQFMFEQRQANSEFDRNLTNLGDALAQYKESNDMEVAELHEKHDSLSKSHAELQKKTTNKDVQMEKSIKTNSDAVKAVSLDVDKNATAIKKNEDNLADLQSDFDSSLWFGRLVLTADQTISTANTYQLLPIKTYFSNGSFYTLSSDGKKLTFTKKVVASVTAQVYFSTGYAASTTLRGEVKVNGETMIRGATVCSVASPYTTVPMAGVTKVFNVGDYLELQAYSSKAGGLVASYSFYSYLNVDVKGVI